MKRDLKSLSVLSLATAIILGVSGCSSDGSSASSTSTDVTVERGPVYDANVTDAAGQVAKQKSGQNVYTFAQTPTYPITVKGGWIDVDHDEIKSVYDMTLHVEMKSYSNKVTPITTYIADANQTIREARLQNLLSVVNADGIGVITAEDLLKVPSEAPDKAQIANSVLYRGMLATDKTITDVAILAGMNWFMNYYSDAASLSTKEKAAAYELLLLNEVIPEIYNANKVSLDTIPRIPITQEMLSGQIFYTQFNDTQANTTIYGKNIINADGTVTRHEMVIDANGVSLTDSEWTSTFPYLLENEKIMILSGAKSRTLCGINKANTKWFLIKESAKPEFWYKEKLKSFPKSL